MVLTLSQEISHILAGHSSFTVNKSTTRIRCDGAACQAVLDIEAGTTPQETFFRHRRSTLGRLAQPDGPGTPADAPDSTSTPAPPATVEPAPAQGVNVGDRVRAIFKTDVFDPFTVEGTVIEGLEPSTLIVGSWLLARRGVPAPALQDLTILAAAGSHSHPVTPGSSSPDHFGV
ncbi:hypothetical protein [Arthrobacter sp. A2-55]|uniref:hypothetical protein n=1 Tax=Arthrobacter sp. A2-55 TaxID=2897337 RepID=UPI0021CD835A|nr:hypothetical protein [Arthrobacter sp. A2-55]MCU6481325.1 hypothetical protein [Arthrobacter sp. A2-55]